MSLTADCGDCIHEYTKTCVSCSNREKHEMSILQGIVTPQVPPKPKSILAEAEYLVNGPRQANYGDPTECMQRTVDIFYAITGIRLEAQHAPLFNLAQKLARERVVYKRDNPRDMAGYLLIYNGIMERKAGINTNEIVPE